MFAREFCIDVTRLTGRLLTGRLPTGVDRVDIEYIRHFHHNSRALIRYQGRWIFFSFFESKKIFDALIEQNSQKKWMIRRLVVQSYFCYFGKSPSPGTLLLNISHSGLEKKSYREKLLQYGLKPILFVHDLIPIIYPEYSVPGQEILHFNRMETVLLTNAAVIVNSEDTRKRFETFAIYRSVKIPNITVGHLASAPLVSGLHPMLIEKPYFVMLGTIEPRKNHWMILHVWRQIVEEFGEASPILVIIGQRGWESENVVDMLERCQSIKPYIIEKQFCPDHELAAYLSHARALLFPSFIEGYGIPLIEALSLGTPVIASNLAVFHEISGEIPEYLDPIDGIGWKAMISEYMKSDSKAYTAQMERMKGFVPPTWDEHFNKVEKMIDSLE